MVSCSPSLISLLLPVVLLSGVLLTVLFSDVLLPITPPSGLTLYGSSNGLTVHTGLAFRASSVWSYSRFFFGVVLLYYHSSGLSCSLRVYLSLSFKHQFKDTEKSGTMERDAARTFRDIHGS